ncbi:MAG: hypothetical protein II847_02120 [Ruminobacter sp.]|uniref:Uncharacterized protein n=1 Tax=Ruminobacter amylophilus TaxID=867 RepID=A0A662ZEN7_9GAMM|nr:MULTISPECIES: hypothetical protein [Ruminobacter]MBQ3774911.1 hypothetical protein [Ruminobacter sp.]SFP06763.1 hypothetical protein SAMN02910344_00346 [Ruminobacter amylophilus]
MTAKLYELNTEILGKLVESPEASQNFIESIIKDLPGTVDVETISDVTVGDMNSSKVAGKSAEGFSQINGIVFQFSLNSKPAEMILVVEPVSFLKWWHDKSFFSYKLYRNHSNINDGVRRFVTFVVTDSEVKASRFHAVSCFNNNNGDKCESCQIHDIFAVKQSGNEDSMLENWIRALISKSDADESTNNVSSITEASGYKVA